MRKVQQSANDITIVQAAEKLGCLHETCIWTEYHHDFGRVQGYWKPKWFVEDMLQTLNKQK